MYEKSSESQSHYWLWYKFCGICLLSLSFIISLSFMGHYFAYSGWYHYSRSPIQYHLSTVGLYLSDITMSYLGPIATLVSALILFSWGYILILYNKPITIKQVWYLSWLLIFTSALGSAFQTLLTWHFPLGWGGYFGDLMHEIMLWIRDIMGFSYLFAWEVGILGTVSIILFYKTLSLHLGMFLDIAKWCSIKYQTVLQVIQFVFYGIKGIISSIVYLFTLLKSICFSLLEGIKSVIYYFVPLEQNVIPNTVLENEAITLSSDKIESDYLDPLKLTNESNVDSNLTSSSADSDTVNNESSSQNTTVTTTGSTALSATYAYYNTNYVMPPKQLLSCSIQSDPVKINDNDVLQISEILKKTLDEFNIPGEIINISVGPIISIFEFKPGPGIKFSRITALEKDLARVLCVHSIRIGTVEGSDAIGIEIPNKNQQVVTAASLYHNPLFQKNAPALTLTLGKKVNGDPMFVDLAKMPHLMIAGTTGSGKSVAVNTMIVSLLYRLAPHECRLILIDPKQLEFSLYEDIPHLLMPVITESEKAIISLRWAVAEMESRYLKMSAAGVRNIVNYNSLAQKRGTKVQVGFDIYSNKPLYKNLSEDLIPMPYIVIIVDELADLMMTAGKEIEVLIQRLAQMARAAGIHLIISTQRPSVDVITGTIKANFPVRISFQVSSGIDSKTILGVQGAETLLGNGDMLLMQSNGKITRIHGCFISDDDVKQVIDYLKNQGLKNQYVDLSNFENT